MKKQVLTYIKPAAELKAGDRILTNRMAVAVVESVDAAGAPDGKKSIHVLANGVTGIGLCFIEDEQVLVIE